MTKQEAKKRIEKLKKVINHHRHLYHVLDKQEISDAVLDSLKHELHRLEQQFSDLITPDSPTQRVGGQSLKEFKKVEHKIPMLSIEDVFSEKELQDWENYLKRLLHVRLVGDESKDSSSSSLLLRKSSLIEYFVEYKIDGFAVTLIYQNGIFTTGATRGNGKIGEDVTQNLKTIESIPLKLEVGKSVLDKTIEIRGEVFMKKDDFEKFRSTYANPRNLAAGSIRQLNPKLAASRPLKFLAYDIVYDMGQKKHSEEHEILPKLGFKTEPGKICKNVSDIVDFWREIAKKREILPYQIDGVVISINDNALFRRLGVVGKSPRGIRAFKFSPKQATTKVLDIKVQVGRTGAITPIAYLKPVEVAGVTISRATLHNEDEIKRLKVEIGDTVIVERAGDVIPAVAKVLPELRTSKEKEFHFPKTCPVCEAKLIKPKSEAIWRCPNHNCPARKRKKLYFFASKKAFDIEGLGPKIINQLLDEKLISNIPDIFDLTEGDLAPLERFAEKKAKNIVEAIQESKKIPLSRFIYALGIRHVGEETAIDLADYFGDINKLKKASEEELEKIPDVGEKVSKSISSWFHSNQHRKLIKGLLDAGVEIIPPKRTGKKLKGKTFVLTGSLGSTTRSEAERKIRMLGGRPSGSVSKNTDYLVAGLNPGSKLEEAKKLGVKVISEREFLKLIS